MARALMTALERSGREVMLASQLRSFDRNGDAARQKRIEDLGARVADRLIARYRKMPSARRPRAWLTYHAYHKSPDWLGPAVRRSLNIPYLLIETSFARKQAGGAWDLGHRAAEAAIRTADVTLAMTAVDEAGLDALVDPPAMLERLPPFLDPLPYQRALSMRERHRTGLAERIGLDAAVPWLLAVGMMRDDVKTSSYQLLAKALSEILDRRWQLIVVGDGVSRSMVENFFGKLGSKRVKFAGMLDEDQLPACYAAADVYAWPAIREAYGMALLEAQASGLPVVAGCEGGVRDVVRNGVTGILTTPRDSGSLASAIADLLDHPSKRREMSLAALGYVHDEHSLDRASAVLDRSLHAASAVFAAKPGLRSAVP